MLRTYTPAGLQALARIAGVGRVTSPRDLPGQVAKALLKPDRLKAGLASLAAEERGFLAFAGRLGGTVGAAHADWWLRRHGLADPLQAVRRLVEQGLVFPIAGIRAATHETEEQVEVAPVGLASGLVVPEPVARLAGHAEPPTLVARLEPLPVEPASLTETLRELFILTRFVSTKQPRGATTSGHLGQPDLAELAAALGRPEATRRPRRLEEMPDLLWLESVALQADLIEVRDRRLGGATESGETLFLLPPVEQCRTLLEAAVAQTGWGELEAAQAVALAHTGALRPGESDIPSPGARIRARRRVLEMLTTAARPGEWHGLADLTERLMESGPDFLVRRRLPDRARGSTDPHDAGAGDGREPTYRGLRQATDGEPEPIGMVSGWQWVEGVFVAEFLRSSLRRVGVVDLSEDCFRLTPRGAQALEMTAEVAEEEAPSARFFVQPNFEIVADGSGGNLAGVVRLSRVAELESFDRAAMLRLTRDSVCRALDQGLTKAGILDLLSDHGRSPVPQNVSFSVEEWLAAYQRFRIRTDAWVVETDEPAELDALAREFPEGLDRIGPTAARVLPEHRAAVEAALTRRNDALVVDHAAGLRAAFELDDGLGVTLDPGQRQWYLDHMLGQIAEADPGGLGYRLTPVSLRSALEAGLTAGEIEAFVCQCAKQPLSPLQLLLLRGWLGRYEPVALASVMVLRAPPEACADLVAVPGIREALSGVIGPSAFVVKREAAEAVRRLLEEAGVVVREDLGVAPRRDPAPVGDVATPPGDYERGWGRRGWRAGEPEEAREALLRHAIEARRRVAVMYRPVIKGEVSQQWELSPERLETTRWGLPRLHAFCHQRGEPRAFDLARMDGIVLLDEPASSA